MEQIEFFFIYNILAIEIKQYICKTCLVFYLFAFSTCRYLLRTGIIYKKSVDVGSGFYVVIISVRRSNCFNVMIFKSGYGTYIPLTVNFTA